MDRLLVKWPLLTLLSLVLGALYAGFLTAHPLKMSWFMFGATLALCAQ